VKILITGHKGFIGKLLYSTLQELGYNVYGLDDEYLSENDWFTSLPIWLNALNPNAIFHVGACSDTLEQDVNYMMERNFESTKILVDWSVRNSVPIISSSSAANYGTNNQYPANLYGWSKYAAEQYLLAKGGLALRYFNVYGPGEEDKGSMASVAYQMMVKQQNNQEILLFPKKPQRDFIYVKDVVAANIHALDNYQKLCGSYYEVGLGQAHTFEDVLDNLGIAYSYTHEQAIPKGYQFYTCCNKYKWMPGWEPKFTLQTGLIDYKSNHFISGGIGQFSDASSMLNLNTVA
jgi:ADP-L-glycero-D-manno-heptose 6-epimerase